ncbi:helix-turn-helix transcriptional regulator [Sphingopyxis sp. SE2]|jgi:DNA-binding CsgD family transcriptional regulator|uniref:helix-turn-helix transcriptional regulator n=1 Tax=Sphingopyxis sp. SE2 TaxID=1586240 RepID=UPI0028C21C3B|nr:helix-turn-helix transcriptional regulator [Sphingopyxis sp. SE2]MDT7529018.1 helix-turn-helix transcriptional regulator [Sphingopyxis sp. SE2]
MDDSGSHPPDDEDRWNRLTDKQRACLDMLIEHKTSKEIARLLDISKHTVDQRLTTARDVLGAADRNETAVIYRRLKQTYDRMTYDAVGIPPSPALVRSEFPDGSPPNLMELHDSSEVLGRQSSNRSPFGDLLRPDHSSAARIGITLTLVGAIVLIGLGGLSIGQTLTELLTR